MHNCQFCSRLFFLLQMSLAFVRIKGFTPNGEQ